MYFIVTSINFSFMLELKLQQTNVLPNSEKCVPQKTLFSPGIEPGTFCVLDRCDNRYTTKTG